MHEHAVAPYRSEAELQQLLQAFETCTLPYASWTHTAHLSVAAMLVLRHGDGALDAIRKGIQRLNASFGIEMTPTGGYHESITVAWTRLIANHLARLPDGTPPHDKVNSVVEAFTDKNVLLAHYSRDLMMSVDARYGFVEPDLKPLP
jgi:hypothetical protein